MKLNSAILALIATGSTQVLASPAPVQMNELCVKQISSAVSILNGEFSQDEKGNISVAPADIAAVNISKVKVLSSSCRGPADCDAKHPDSFVYAADVGKKGEGAHGRVVVSYHRGVCFVEKIALKQ